MKTIIINSGVAGLTTAAVLAHAGHDTTVRANRIHPGELGLLERVKIRKEDRGYVFPDFELKKPVDYNSPLW